jgi:tyrosyl-tRNA synthetase
MPNAFLEDLKWRGLLYQHTDFASLEKRLNEGPIIGYCGFDPSADSFTVGNLVAMVLLKRLMLSGHKPVLLLGGVTGMIGDPKPDSERQQLSMEQIAFNMAAVEKQVRKFIGSDGIQVVNNADWLGKLNLVEYLRDIGKYFSVNVMMGKDSVQSRLSRDVGISFTEFSYQTLQGYDFYHLLTTINCELQCCGADQWGNVTAGLDYIRKRLHREAYAFSTPLVTKADGKKFGKSESGAIWLDPKKTSPYQFYQFWLNVEDSKVIEYMKIYSFKSRGEIEKIAAEFAVHPEQRAAQKALADELTELVHSKRDLQQAIAASKALFGLSEIKDLEADTLRAVCATIPSMKIAAGQGVPDLASALIETKLVDSKNKARQEIIAGGVYVNNVRATVETKLSEADFIHGCIVLRKGKKNCAAVVKG